MTEGERGNIPLVHSVEVCTREQSNCLMERDNSPIEYRIVHKIYIHVHVCLLLLVTVHKEINAQTKSLSGGH